METMDVGVCYVLGVLCPFNASRTVVYFPLVAYALSHIHGRIDWREDLLLFALSRTWAWYDGRDSHGCHLSSESTKLQPILTLVNLC